MLCRFQPPGRGSSAIDTDEGDEDSQAGSVAFPPDTPPFTRSDCLAAQEQATFRSFDKNQAYLTARIQANNDSDVNDIDALPLAAVQPSQPMLDDIYAGIVWPEPPVDHALLVHCFRGESLQDWRPDRHTRPYGKLGGTLKYYSYHRFQQCRDVRRLARAAGRELSIVTRVRSLNGIV